MKFARTEYEAYDQPDSWVEGETVSKEACSSTRMTYIHPSWRPFSLDRLLANGKDVFSKTRMAYACQRSRGLRVRGRRGQAWRARDCRASVVMAEIIRFSEAPFLRPVARHPHHPWAALPFTKQWLVTCSAGGMARDVWSVAHAVQHSTAHPLSPLLDHRDSPNLPSSPQLHP